MKTILLSIIVMFAAGHLWAHEGHDHDAPVTLQAQKGKGGLIKALEETRVEVVSEGQTLKIYLYDKQMNPKSVSGFEVKATAEIPRSKKQVDIPLVAKAESYEASYDAKGLHRYTLKLQIKDPKTGHNDRLSFTIEPNNGSNH